MSVAPVDFREALKNFPGGVTVVTTTRADGRPVGATVSAFASLSLDPPLVVVCLKDPSRSAAAIKQRGSFVVHFLDSNQASLARRFASDLDDKFFDLDYEITDSGLPVLPDCPHHLECEVYSFAPGGDHLIFIGMVMATRGESDFEPLVYANRHFFALGSTVE